MLGRGRNMRARQFLPGFRYLATIPAGLTFDFSLLPSLTIDYPVGEVAVKGLLDGSGRDGMPLHDSIRNSTQAGCPFGFAQLPWLVLGLWHSACIKNSSPDKLSELLKITCEYSRLESLDPVLVSSC